MSSRRWQKPKLRGAKGKVVWECPRCHLRDYTPANARIKPLCSRCLLYEGKRIGMGRKGVMP